MWRLAAIPLLALALPASPPDREVAGILREEGFPAAGAPSSPETLARALQAVGFETRFLTAAELADPEILRPRTLAIVVLPYGATFPAAARESFTAYLHAGGSFISTGGYAFRDLRLYEGGRWVREADVLERRLAEALREEHCLVPDPGFEKEETRAAPAGEPGTSGNWRRSPERCEVVAESPAAGSWCARVTAADPQGGCEWRLGLPAAPGHSYRVRAALRTAAVEGPGYAYLAVYQYAADGRFLEHRDFAQVRGTSPWTRHGCDLTPAPGAASLQLKAGLYLARGTAWIDDFGLWDITGARAQPMNTAAGTPADGLVVSEGQIGAFDADYRLERVARVESAPGQHLFPRGLTFGPVSGWAASGVRGWRGARWLSLLDARDRYGRPRGSAGALIFHHTGFFAGSAWAYFGVESRDLFAAGETAALAGLGRLARFMARRVYLREVRSELAACEPGEEACLEATVENLSGEGAEALVEFHLEDAVPAALEPRALLVPPGGSASARVTIEVPRDRRALLRFTAALSLGGERADELDAALVVLDPPGRAAGAPLRLRDNYLAYGERSLFLFGSDTHSNVYLSASQGPLEWDREHQAARDFGFQIYENLGYTHPGHVMAEADWRRFRGMARLAREHGLTFMPGILIGHNVAVSREQVAEESRLCREYAARLQGEPKLLWYLNGDYQLRHDDLAMLKDRWNAFLAERYGVTERLREAWAPEAPGAAIGELPFPPANSGRWESVPQLDLHRFHLELLREWNSSHVAAIRAEDGAHPITSEYYSFPFAGIDLRLTIDGLDLANIGYFDEPGKDIDRLPLRIRWNDMRAEGKSVSLGEYGVKTHPAWAAGGGASGYHIARSREEQLRLFMAVAHYAFGMGCSRIQNWCLRDAEESVFPWGVFHPGPLVPKDVAWVHRNLSLCLRLVEPRYEPPALAVLVSDDLRLGNFPELGLESACRAFRALLALRADFNVLGSASASGIPRTTRAVIFPAALCLDDEAFAALERWVRAGGVLLLTGGPVHDADRRLSRAGRLERLAGVEWVGAAGAVTERAGRKARPLAATSTGAAQGLPPLEAAPFARVRAREATVLAADGDAAPVLTRHVLGEGAVYFFADPLELAAENGGTLERLYGWFLGQAGIEGLAVTPRDGRLHAFARRTRRGRAHVLFNTRAGASHLDAALETAAGRVMLRVRDGYPALAVSRDDGRLTAAGAWQSVRVGGREILSASGLVTAAALDGLDLRASGALLVFPFSPGRVRIVSDRAWRKPAVDLGEIHGGRFRVLEKLPGPPAGGGEPVVFELELDADRATLVGLLSEESEAERWRDLLGVLASAPERVQER